MHGSMNIHFCESVTVGPLEFCGDNGMVVFRRIVVETQTGEQFELTVFGKTVVNNMENTNEQQ